MPPVPRWRERALPQSTLGAPRLTFGIGVSAARVARPIKRQSAPHHKACDIVLALITGGDQAGELVACTRKTANGGGPQAISKYTGRKTTASIESTIRAATTLAPLGRVDPENPDRNARDRDRIAVEHAGTTDDLAGHGFGYCISQTRGRLRRGIRQVSTLRCRQQPAVTRPQQASSRMRRFMAAGLPIRRHLTSSGLHAKVESEPERRWERGRSHPAPRAFSYPRSFAACANDSGV
jgi:hypothetical protein